MSYHPPYHERPTYPYSYQPYQHNHVAGFNSLAFQNQHTQYNCHPPTPAQPPSLPLFSPNQPQDTQDWSFKDIKLNHERKMWGIEEERNQSNQQGEMVIIKSTLLDYMSQLAEIKRQYECN